MSLRGDLLLLFRTCCSGRMYRCSCVQNTHPRKGPRYPHKHGDECLYTAVGPISPMCASSRVLQLSVSLFLLSICLCKCLSGHESLTQEHSDTSLLDSSGDAGPSDEEIVGWTGRFSFLVTSEEFLSPPRQMSLLSLCSAASLSFPRFSLRFRAMSWECPESVRFLRSLLQSRLGPIHMDRGLCRNLSLSFSLSTRASLAVRTHGHLHTSASGWSMWWRDTRRHSRGTARTCTQRLRAPAPCVYRREEERTRFHVSVNCL